MQGYNSTSVIWHGQRNTCTQHQYQCIEEYSVHAKQMDKQEAAQSGR